VRGFQNTADALFPGDATYLDVPGERVLAGHYQELYLAGGEGFVVLASTGVGASDLAVMRYGTWTPCTIPDVAQFWALTSNLSERFYVAYYDNENSGLLHFADASCTIYDFTLEGGVPIAFTPTRLVIQAGTDLLLVDPVSGVADVLAADVEAIDASARVVQHAGELMIFDQLWRPLGEFGNNVVNSQVAFGRTYFEDRSGIHMLIGTSQLLIAPGACGLAVLPASAVLNLLAFHEPCAEPNLILWDADVDTAAPLELSADSSYVRIFPAHPASAARVHPDISVDPLFALYLTNVDEQSQTGTLMLRAPDGTVLTLGDHAALERAELVTAEAGDDEYSGGFALVDVDGDSGRFVAWDMNGNVSEVAENVLRENEPGWSHLMLDAGAGLANLDEIVGGAAVELAHAVPRSGFLDTGFVKTRNAWLHDSDGQTGTLSLVQPGSPTGARDDELHEPLFTRTPVAHGVFAARHQFLTSFDGLGYLTHFDPRTDTGRLEYKNLDLDFSAVVSDGVYDFAQPGLGLLYTVPYGDAAGIWFAPSR
jgi:hypothetical protein